jgi:gp45 sliding clamp, C terminal
MKPKKATKTTSNGQTLAAPETAAESSITLTSETIRVLRNFSHIHPTLHFPEGNTLYTRSATRDIYAQATVTETFPRQFSIHDLKLFLAVAERFTEPTLHFKDAAYLTITGSTGANLVVNYRLGDDSLSYIPDPQNPVELHSIELEFPLSAKHFNQLTKLAHALGTPDLVAECDGVNLQLLARSTGNAGANVSTLPIGAAPNNTRFSFIWKFDHLKLLDGEYVVAVSRSGLSRFRHQTSDVTYHVPLDSNSQYDGAPVGRTI